MSKKKRIVLVEDEPDISETIEFKLGSEGFDVVVYDRGDEALEAILRAPPDLVLLDLMLPGMDGVDVCRRLKSTKQTRSLPIIMLTARGREEDRIVGLEVGADDYITKPFSPREMVLRVRAVLRRSEIRGTDVARVLEVGIIRIDTDAHTVSVADEQVSLTATEFRLLEFLMSRAGRVQHRDALLRDVWDYADDVDSRTVDTHIRRLRRKLGRAANAIETIVGIGYRLRREF